MKWITPRERLFRARVEMVVLLLGQTRSAKLSALSQAMDVHPSYLCRFLRGLAGVGLIHRLRWGTYTLAVPSGNFEWRWLEIPLLLEVPNVIAYRRFCGELEYRWCETLDSREPSWPWGDYIDRAARQWSPTAFGKRSLWKSLRSSVVRAYLKVVSRVRT